MDLSLSAPMSVPAASPLAGLTPIPVVLPTPAQVVVLQRPLVDVHPSPSANALSKRPTSASGSAADGRQSRPRYQPPADETPVTADDAINLIR